MASADAIEDEWWLEGGEEGGEEGEDEHGFGASSPKKRKLEGELEEEGIKTKNKRNRRKKIQDIEPEMRESFSDQHSLARQREELSRAFQSTTEHTKELALKKSHFVKYYRPKGEGEREEEEEEKEEAPDISNYCRAVCLQWCEWMAGPPAAGLTEGSPIVIVLTASASRAVHLRRELHGFAEGCVIAKLFGKHMRLDQQTSFLSTHPTPLAVATPARLNTLTNAGSLHLEALKYLVVDWYWRDQKLRNFHSIPEIWADFVTLYRSHLYHLVVKKQTKIALY